MKKEGQAAKTEVVEIDHYDLATLLGCLASDLRNTGLAIRGMGGYRGADTRDQELADLDRLAGSLDRMAEILDATRGGLCLACGLRDISEQIRLGESKARTLQEKSLAAR